MTYSATFNHCMTYSATFTSLHDLATFTSLRSTIVASTPDHAFNTTSPACTSVCHMTPAKHNCTQQPFPEGFAARWSAPVGGFQPSSTVLAAQSCACHRARSRAHTCARRCALSCAFSCARACVVPACAQLALVHAQRPRPRALRARPGARSRQPAQAAHAATSASAKRNLLRSSAASANSGGGGVGAPPQLSGS
jgi:hypothetical protein